jgi:hypothetical protein
VEGETSGGREELQEAALGVSWVVSPQEEDLVAQEQAHH